MTVSIKYLLATLIWDIKNDELSAMKACTLFKLNFVWKSNITDNMINKNGFKIDYQIYKIYKKLYKIYYHNF